MSDPPCEGIKTEIGPLTTLQIYAEIDEIERFDRATELVRRTWASSTRLREQKNKPEKGARVAAGRKLLVSIFHMLSREEVPLISSE